MYVWLQIMCPTSRKSTQRFWSWKKCSPRCCLSRRIHQNSKNLINDLRFLQWKRTKQKYQSWWSRRLWCCCLICYSYQLIFWINLRCITFGCCPTFHGYRNCWRCYVNFNSKKYHCSNQKIINFHHLFW